MIQIVVLALLLSVSNGFQPSQGTVVAPGDLSAKAFVEVEQACPSGTVLQGPQNPSSLPSYANVGGSGFSCSGTGQSNSNVCAPSGPYTTVGGTFIIWPTASKNNATAGYGYSSGTQLPRVSFGAYPNWELSVTVEAAEIGWVRYEWCDANNNYGRWIAPINAAGSGPSPSPSPTPSPTPSPPSPTPAPAPGCNNKLPQAQTFPSGYNVQVLGNPFTQSPTITCGTATSSCPVCAPTNPVHSGTYTISSGCPQLPKAAGYGTYGYGTVNASWTSNSGISATIKTSPNGGYVKYEFCDQNNGYGRWVLFYN